MIPGTQNKRVLALASGAAAKAFSALWVMAGVSLISFLLSVLAPGDPAYLILKADGNAEPTRSEIQEMRRELGLDRPLHTQYLDWLGRILKGDMGRSYVTGEEIRTEMGARLPITLKLAMIAIVWAALAGLGLGLLTASARNRLPDRAGQTIGTALISVPDFWLAILLIGIFCEYLGLFPTSGAGSAKAFILPALVLSAGSVGSLARLTRTLILNEMGRDYMITARSKGIGENRVLVRHGLANIMVPAATALGLQFGHLLGGAVIVESIFALPGIGQYALTGICNRDYPVIQAFVLYTAGIYILVNSCMDMVYMAINPGMRPGGGYK